MKFKEKYTSPTFNILYVKMEESTAVGSRVKFKGNTGAAPEIEEQPVDEKHFDIEF